MAGFFSLGRGGTSRLASNTAQQEGDGGGTGGRDNTNSHNLASQANTGINPETSWFLYRNEEITYRGSELWQQQQTMQLQQQRINHPADLYASEVGLGVGPGGGGSSSRNNSDHDQSNTGGGVRSGGYLMTRGIGTGVGSVGSCQDCGNQAKKDCVHVRCRTCCKSRGFQCATHVRSTWVPAARRRERLQQQQKHYTEAASLDHLSKRHRESDRHHHASSSTRLPSATLSAGTNMLDLHNLPSELSSEALFRCVKVSPIDDEDNNRNEQQFAYQTAVKIGGHIFKGILYDQGPESSSYRSGGDTSSGTGGAPPQPPPLDRTSAAPTTSATPSSSAGPMASSPVVFLDPSFYPAPPPSFMAGTQFLPNPRP